MARCSTCHGVGHVLIDRAQNIVATVAEASLLIPCPAGCLGGEQHCCDGLTACNDAPAPNLQEKLAGSSRAPAEGEEP